MDPGAEPAAAATPSLNAAAPAALAGNGARRLRSVVAYLAIALYVLLVAPPACCWRSPSAGRACSTSSGTAASAWACAVRHPVPRERPRARAARPRGRVLREPPEQRRSAGAVPGAASAAAHPLQGRDLQDPAARARDAGRRVRAGGSPGSGAVVASIARGAESIRAGNSFLIFPEGTRSRTDGPAALQEGRLHHGDQGAGADRAGGGHRRARRDAKGSPLVARSRCACGSASRSRRPV